jgi:hypothetical protein
MHRLLDINDLDVGLLGSDQTQRSPGFASMLNKKLVFGEQARAISRLNPGLSANQYWRDLSTQQSSANFPAVRHQADLAWNHLQAFDRSNLKQVSLVAVPSHYGKDQIALLSGVLKSLDVTDTLLCKRSLLMASLYPEAEYQIDFQLHQLVVTKIETKGGEIHCGEMVEHPGLGLLGCSDALLKGIQSRFIDKTRFDPLHHAVTEQQLFNQIMEHLLPQPWRRIDLKIEMDSHENSIELSEQQLRASAENYLQRVSKVLPKGTYVADTLFGNLPIEAGDAIYLAENEAIQALENILAGSSSEDQFSELTAVVAKVRPQRAAASLPKVVAENSAPELKNNAATSSEPPSPAASATHLLLNGLAHPALESLIVAQNNRISIDAKSSDGDAVLARFTSDSGSLVLNPEEGISLNGAKVLGPTPLQPNDLISHQDLAGTLVVIEVAG